MGLILAGLLTACTWQTGPSTSEARLTILAAVSLSDVLPQAIGEDSQAIRFHLAATSRLARQARSGAPGDLFFSADSTWMDWLEEAGQIQPGTRVDLASNRLVVIVPSTTAKVPGHLDSLAADPPDHLALAGEAVPAGRYARAALSQHPDWSILSTRIVNGSNVRTALEWVAAGEAEAGVVYATDAAMEPRVQVAFALPSPTPIIYNAGVLVQSTNPEAARALLDRLLAPGAQEVLAEHGFSLPARASHNGSPAQEGGE